MVYMCKVVVGTDCTAEVVPMMSHLSKHSMEPNQFKPKPQLMKKQVGNCIRVW